MHVEFGSLDRLIVIQVRSLGNDDRGGKSATWSTWAQPWATVKSASGGKYFAAQQMNAQVDEVFRIRYAAGLKTTMRVQYNAQIYEIVRIVELGRAHGWDIYARLPQAE